MSVLRSWSISRSHNTSTVISHQAVRGLLNNNRCHSSSGRYRRCRWAQQHHSKPATPPTHIVGAAVLGCALASITDLFSAAASTTTAAAAATTIALPSVTTHSPRLSATSLSQAPSLSPRQHPLQAAHRFPAPHRWVRCSHYMAAVLARSNSERWLAFAIVFFSCFIEHHRHSGVPFQFM